MRTFIRILGYGEFKKKHFLLYTGLVLFSVLFSLINFTALIPVLELLFDQVKYDPNPETSGLAGLKNIFYTWLQDVLDREGRATALLWVSLVVLVSVFLSNLFRYSSDLVLVRFRANVIYAIRSDFFSSIVALPLSFFGDKKKGDIISRATTDIQEIETSIIYALKVFLKEPVLMIGYAVILFSISFELALYTLLLIPVSGVIIASIARKLKRKAADSQKVLGEVGFLLDETLSSMRLVKGFNAQKFVKDQFDKRVKHYANFNRSMGSRFQLAGPLSEFLGVSIMVLILIIGGGMVLDPNDPLNAAQFIGFLIIFSQILAPAKAMSQAHSLAQRGIASADRVFEVVDDHAIVSEAESPSAILEFHNSIRFRDVSFAYEQKPVLKNVDFTFVRGRSYALIGPSGEGKTTLVDLIARFHDPSQGSIEIDGKDLRSLDIKSLRDLVGLVSQEVLLFNDTVYNNITLGGPFTMDQVIEASKMANAHKFISDLPGGYESTIGDQGSKLSGGQRQRIAIARAILKDAPILILDEATSALDTSSEREIRQAIDHLMKNRTSIIITHRLETIQDCDQIIVLEKGRITQTGSHRDLESTKGYYRDSRWYKTLFQ